MCCGRRQDANPSIVPRGLLLMVLRARASAFQEQQSFTPIVGENQLIGRGSADHRPATRSDCLGRERRVTVALEHALRNHSKSSRTGHNPTCSQPFETTESCGEERSRGAAANTVAEVAGLAQSDNVNLLKCISALSEAKRGVVVRGKRLKVDSRCRARATAGRPYAVRCPRSLAQRWHRRTRASRTKRLTRASL